jgi:hypothetical protein
MSYYLSTTTPHTRKRAIYLMKKKDELQTHFQDYLLKLNPRMYGACAYMEHQLIGSDRSALLGVLGTPKYPP